MGLCPRCCATCQVCETIADLCTGLPVSGATVTIKQGATTIGTCTTDALGQCCVAVPAAGSYTETLAATGYTGASFAAFSATCPGLNPRSHSLGGNNFCETVTGCGGAPFPGATVTITLGGTSYSGTTDASGKWCSPTGIATGTYTLTIAPNDAAYNTPSSRSVTIHSGCNTDATALVIASGYCCVQCGSGYVILAPGVSLSFSDTLFGSCTLSRVTDCEWSGTITYSYPGCHAGPLCSPKSVVLTVEFGAASSGSTGYLRIRYGVDVDDCPTGSGTGECIGEGPVGACNGTDSYTNSCTPSPFVFTRSWGPGLSNLTCGSSHTSTITP